MKKLLSVILAVSLMMSLFCVVPASAEMINTWPYFFEDYEDAANSLQSSVAATIVEGGANGSQYAGQYPVPASSASGDRDIKIFAGSTNLLLETGDTIKFYADVKTSVDICKNATFYMHYTAANNTPNFTANGYVNIGSNRPNVLVDTKKDTWTKMEYTGVYTGLDVKIDGSMGVSIRMPKVDSEYTVTLDNVEFEVFKDAAVAAQKTPRVIFENDFSEGMDGFTYTGTTAEGSGLSVTEDGVLQMVDTDSTKQSANGHVKFTMNVGEALRTNKLYLLTYKAKIVSATQNQDVETPTAWPETKASKHRWSLDGVGTKIEFEDNSVIKCNDTWNNVGIVFNVASETAATFDTGVLDFRWWITYDGTGSDTATYQFDDFKLVEIEGFVDGDFDYGDFKVFKEVNETNALAGVVPTIAKNWTSVNARVSAANTSSLHSKPYMRTMYFDAIDGTAQNSIAVYLEAGQKYKFSTFIDPCATNSCGTMRVAINYTYTDETEANTVNIIDIAPPAVRGYKEYTAEFTTPANMATAEVVVTELGTGADVSRFETSKNLADYTDDWCFTKLPSANIPVVTAEATTAADGIVAVAKTFVAPEGTNDLSVIKFTATKNGVKSYIGSTKTSHFTVPESYRTGYELAAEITPIGSNGYIGKTVTVEVPAVPVIAEMSFAATADTGATLTSPEAISGKVIWVAYDSFGKMLDWSEADIAVGEGGGSQNVPVPEDFDATGADSVKVMLWEDIVNCVPMADAVEY